jgi:dihydrofolate reductase
VIKIIVAISKNRVIGKDNKLLWKLSSDLQRFKALTSGHSVVMGRKTFQSIGKPLPNRRNIIITRDKSFTVEGCEVVNSIEQALFLTRNDCFVIGGGEIYKHVLDLASKVYLTLVHCDIEGDTYFPELGTGWAEVKVDEHKASDKNEYDFTFIDYEKYIF